MEQELTCEEIDRRVRSIKHRIAEMQAKISVKDKITKTIPTKKPINEIELLRQKLRGN